MPGNFLVPRPVKSEIGREQVLFPRLVKSKIGSERVFVSLQGLQGAKFQVKMGLLLGFMELPNLNTNAYILIPKEKHEPIVPNWFAPDSHIEGTK